MMHEIRLDLDIKAFSSLLDLFFFTIHSDAVVPKFTAQEYGTKRRGVPLDVIFSASLGRTKNAIGYFYVGRPRTTELAAARGNLCS
jgi:hypothetical protein